MKYTLRVPTKEQYAYIEAEYEGEANDAVAAYQELTRAVQGGTGVGIKKLAAIVAEYCKTGSIVEGHEYDFSANEALLVNEVKKLIRANN